MDAGEYDDAFDLVDDLELMQLKALVSRAGAAAATPLLRAVSGVDTLADLNLVTRRQWATLRIALTVVSGDGASA
jgi:hypothetical protein